MVKKKSLTLCRLAVIANVIAACVFYPSCAEPRRGGVIESWETANNTFRVRVTVYGEGNSQQVYQNGAHYTFASAPAGSDHWVEFFVPYLTRREPIARDHIRFVNDNVGYVFWKQWYLVTTNSGRTWTSWNSPKYLSNPADVQCCEIENVNISADGKGLMEVHAPNGQGKTMIELVTQDYGQHWATTD